MLSALLNKNISFLPSICSECSLGSSGPAISTDGLGSSSSSTVVSVRAYSAHLPAARGQQPGGQYPSGYQSGGQRAGAVPGTRSHVPVGSTGLPETHGTASRITRSRVIECQGL